MLKVTTSWDDGDILDKRLSNLLSRYGLKGTFYISKDYRSNRLADKDMRDIAQVHEIGAHTLTHPDLRALTPEEQRAEIKGSKGWLETIVSSEIKMFCYPKGLHNNSVVEIVREAGFLGARTTELGSFNISNPFLIQTTIQVYPFPFRNNLRKFLQPYQQRASALKKLGVPMLSMYSWLSMAKATFDIALNHGKVFHLYGHSWEIEKYGMWNELEKFLQYIGNNKHCVYLTNSELIT
jgi:peptidoglycan/xylan/chitin deacetylase (PgdA/CDA1 family)